MVTPKTARQGTTGDQMSYVITTQRGNAKPLVISDFDANEKDARDWCAHLASNFDKVTLHSLGADGLIAPVASWARGGKRARNLANGTVTAPKPTKVPAAAFSDTITATPEEIEDAHTAGLEAQDAEAIETDEDGIPHDDSHSYEGYCVKCREKREFYGEVKEMANGRRMAKGSCPVCGAGISRILPGKAAEPQDEWHDEDAAESPAEDAPEPEAKETPKKAPAKKATPKKEASPARAEPDAPIKATATVTKMAPAKRVTKKAAAAKETKKDAEAERVSQLKVAECVHCKTKQPVMERAGLTILMQHSGMGKDKCPGSLTEAIKGQ